MAKKFFIAAGHGSNDTGCTYFGKYERDVNIQVVDNIFNSLANQNLNGWEFIKVPHELDLQGAIDWINARSTGFDDFCIEVHFDAPSSTARGSLLIIPNDSRNEAMALNIKAEIERLTGVASRGIYWNENKKWYNSAGALIQTGYGFNNYTKPLSMILECDFLSNQATIQDLDNNNYAVKLGKAIAYGALKTVGGSYVEVVTPPPPPQPTVDDLYRVTFQGKQLGAFANNPIEKINTLQDQLTKLSDVNRQNEEIIGQLREQLGQLERCKVGDQNWQTTQTIFSQKINILKRVAQFLTFWKGVK